MSSLSSSLPSDTAATSTSGDNHAASASTRALRGGMTRFHSVNLFEIHLDPAEHLRIQLARCLVELR